MSTTVNWGVLGAAAIAVERTMPGMQRAASVNLLAIASRDKTKSEAVAAEFGIPRAYGSYDDLLADPDIDAVYIPLPNQLHMPWATRAMEAGKHVLCEKPLSTTIDGVNELIDVRDRTGRHIEEALSYRNHPQWQTVVDLLTAGAIGDIKSVHATMAKRFPDRTDIRNNPDVGGGSLYDMGPYVISACNLIYHGPPVRVVAALETHPEFGVDGLSSALLDYGGRHASITVSIHNGPTGWGSHQQLTALGTNGWIRLTFPFAHGRPTPCRVEVGDTTSAGAYPTSTHEFPPLNQYQLQTDRFSRFVMGEQVPAGRWRMPGTPPAPSTHCSPRPATGPGSPWPTDKARPPTGDRPAGRGWFGPDRFLGAQPDQGVEMRIGVVGYGTGGQNFHTPFIEAADGVELVGVVARSPQRKAAVARDWPGVPIYQSLTDLLAAGVDAVTITTPPATRRDLVLEAVAAGVHVIADKPFAPTAAAAGELEGAAAEAGVLLSVYHNRRWDADIRTLQGIVSAASLGQLWRVHSRFDLDDPATLEAGPEGGLLRDIGTHLVDQMLWLLGPATAVTAHLDWIELPEGRTDAGFVIALQHASGVRSYVESTKINRLAVRELRAYGSSGSYRSYGTDVQARSIFAGRRPASEPETWGYEPEENWGILATAGGERRVPSEQGRYQDLYVQFAAAVSGEGPQPVPAAEGVRTLVVLDAARVSASQGRTVDIADPD